ncbi:TPA: type 1 fimbrial protein [Vibrio parahaemolyticus]|nr:type 1 fimbrial protein [Vibrio parahaemolyticus]
MKRNVLIKIIIASSVLVASSGSYAADGTITFNGKVTAASCTVTGGATGSGSPSTNLNVTMPSITTGSIDTTPGALAGMTAFTITLKDCKSQTTTAEQMRVAFSGQGDPTNVYVLKNTAAGADAATGVGIQLLKEDGTSIIDINGGSNKADEKTLPISTVTAESYVLNFNAAYVNVSGSAPTTGTVTSVANYTIEYN